MLTVPVLCRYEDALGEAKKALELDPDNAEYYHSLGVMLYNMGRHEEALEEMRRASDLDLHNDLYLSDLIGMLHKLGHYGEANVMNWRN